MIHAKRSKFEGKLKSNMRFATKYAPVFGSGPYYDAKPPKGVINSPYYWWFMFLKLNKDYAKTIQNGGAGKYSELYSDFGDVSKYNFKQWWERNLHLFAEPRIGYQMRVAESVSDIVPFDSTEAINLVVPLTLSRRELAKAFKAKILDQFEKGKPLDRLKQTKAKYKLGSKWNIQAMEYAYRIYTEREKVSHISNKLAWADIAVRAKLPCAQGIKGAVKNLDTANMRRNATIQAIRHFKKALKHISAASTRTFPNFG